MERSGATQHEPQPEEWIAIRGKASMLVAF
jgi:hypothetical protein